MKKRINYTTIEKENFDRFGETLSRIDTDSENVYMLGTDTESFAMQPETENRFTLQRRANVAEKESYTEKSFSKNYLIVPVLEMISTIWNTQVFQDKIRNEIESVKIDNKTGSIALNMAGIETFDMPVLDVNLTRVLGERAKSNFTINDFNIQKTKYGDLKRIFTIVNSFDGLRALQLEQSVMRLVCTNGLTVPTSFMGSSSGFDKFRHSKGNAEKIRETIEKYLQDIANFSDKMKGLKECKNLGYDEKRKIFVQDTVNNYYNEKKQTETYKKPAIMQAVNNFYNTFLELSEYFNNHLDFLNTISYFTAKPNGVNRFSSTVATCASEIANYVNKNILVVE
jgi:hypothetical protein